MNLARGSVLFHANSRSVVSGFTWKQAVTPTPSRAYAISRFPKTLNRAGRTRGILDWPCWISLFLVLTSWCEAVLKPVDGNKRDVRPEIYEEMQSESKGIDDNDGLRRLLFHSNTLVIERLVCLYPRLFDEDWPFIRQLEMLNVFIGFEQSNKYTISMLPAAWSSSGCITFCYCQAILLGSILAI
jgi:hypothetical protein